MKSAILLILVFSCPQIFAATINYKPLRVPVAAGDHVKIIGFHGRVKLVAGNEKDMVVGVKQLQPDSAPDFAKDLFSEWLFSMHKEGSEILLQVRSPQSKPDWNRLLGVEGHPEFILEIQSPPIPTQIAWRTGRIDVEGWKSDLKLTLTEGELSTSRTQGQLEISSQEADVSISLHEGAVNVESYRGDIKLIGIKGEQTVENFIGSISILKSEGPVNLTTFKGGAKVTGHTGKIEFDTERAPLHVSQLQGELNGKSTQGSVTASFRGESRARVTTRQGRVSIRAPRSGAWVNLGTEKGNFAVPSYLRLTRLPSLKLMRGRLRGPNDGQIFVRTESGTIQVR